MLVAVALPLEVYHRDHQLRRHHDSRLVHQQRCHSLQTSAVVVFVCDFAFGLTAVFVCQCAYDSSDRPTAVCLCFERSPHRCVCACVCSGRLTAVVVLVLVLVFVLMFVAVALPLWLCLCL